MAASMPRMVLNAGQASEDRSMRYYLDADLLDCPICTEPFSPPVYQCQSGHSICSSCCQTIPQRICPSCSQPTGKIRSLMVEKIMESLQVPCKHAPHGCKEMFQYSKRAQWRRHEDVTCKHKPLPCPHPSCLHKGPTYALASHLAEAHGVERGQLDSEGCVKLKMSNTDRFMMVDFGNGGLMLVHLEQHSLGDCFFCSTVIGRCETYTLQVDSQADDSIYTIEAAASDTQKVVEKSCVHNGRLLILVADVNKPREYDVELTVPVP